jgi:MFS family permease
VSSNLHTDSGAERPTSVRPAGLGIIFLIIFIDLVGFSIVFPLFPAILDYYFAREGDTGLLGAILAFLGQFDRAGEGSGHFTAVLFGGVLGSIYSFLQFVFAPIWGSLSDRFGRRTILLYTVFGTLMSYVIWFFSGSFLLFILARLLGGAMGGNLSVASAAIADVTSRENRAKGMALIGVAFGLGFTLGPAMGGLLAGWNLLDSFPAAEQFGINPFSVPAAASLILALVNFLGVLFILQETLPPQKRNPAGFSQRNPLKIFYTRSEPPVRKTNSIYFFYILAFSGMEFTLTFLATQRFGFEPRDIGLMFVHIGIVLILTQGVIVRKAVPVLGEKKLTILGLAAMIAAMVILALAPTPGVLYVGLTFMALGAGLTNPTLAALVSLYVGSDRQGETLGIFRSLGSLARAIGPLLASFIFWWFGSMISYMTGALLLLAPLLIAFLLPRPAK